MYSEYSRGVVLGYRRCAGPVAVLHFLKLAYVFIPDINSIARIGWHVLSPYSKRVPEPKNQNILPITDKKNNW